MLKFGLMVKRLLYLNGFATLGAVIHHITHYDLLAMIWWADRYMPVSVPFMQNVGSLRYIVLRLIDQIVFFSLFVFLFVSGFFLAVSLGRQTRTALWEYLLRRMRLLVIPYLIWTAVVMTISFVQGVRYSPLDIIRTILTGSALTPYYYVIVLFQLYLLSPIILPLARAQWKLLLIITGASLMLATTGHYVSFLRINPNGFRTLLALFRDWHLFVFAFWFSLGAVIGSHLKEIGAVFQRIRPILWVFLLVTLIASLIEWELLRRINGKEWLAVNVFFLSNVFAFVFLLCFLAYDEVKLPLSSQMTWLAPKSYGVYLIHLIVIDITARFIAKYIPWLLAYQLPYIGLLLLLGAGVPVLMIVIVDRYPFLNRFHPLLFG
jgi:peptidoglycan/LPS O-acetylase OafA/YrhL